MGRTVKIVVFNLFIVLCCIGLYSPGLLGLTLEGVSVKSVLFLCSIVLLSGVFIIVNNSLLRLPEVCYYNIDAVEEKTLMDVQTIISELSLKDLTLNKKLQDISNACEETMVNLQDAERVIDQTFEKESISYSRYKGVIDNTQQEAVRNFLRVINGLQRTDSLKLTTAGNRELRKQDIAQMDTLLSQVNALSNTLGVLSRSLENTNDNSESEYLLEEIERLSKEAKYYK